MFPDGGPNTSSSDLPTVDLSTFRLTPEDALKCLNGDYNVVVPTPNVKPCNNLDEYLYKSTANSRRASLDQSGTTSRRSSRNSLPHEPFAVPLVRNFSKILKKNHGEHGATSRPFTETIRKRRSNVDVFKRVEQVDLNSGPISHLKKRMNEVVLVSIRRRRKVAFKSRVIEYKGKLTIFDKHMNLYLEDVIESFVYQVGEKTFRRARHRNGILLRGDNIIMIA